MVSGALLVSIFPRDTLSVDKEVLLHFGAKNTCSMQRPIPILRGCTLHIHRYCAVHEAEHGQKCAFWVDQPPCTNNRMPDALSCGDHIHHEQEYKRRNREASWTAQQRARAQDGIHDVSRPGAHCCC